MTNTAEALLAYLIVALIIFAWMYRIDAKPSGGTFFAVVTDRWLGTVSLCTIGPRPKCDPLYPAHSE